MTSSSGALDVEPPDPDPIPADPEIAPEAANRPLDRVDVDRRVVSLHPAPGWTAEVHDEFGMDRTPLVGWAVCRDGIVRPVVADGDGVVAVVDPGVTEGVYINPPLEPVADLPRRAPRRDEPNPFI